MNDESKHSLDELEQWQSLPLSVKVLMTKNRIRKWVEEYHEDGVCVLMTFSPESLVLLHIVNLDYPEVGVAFGETDLKPMTAWMASEDAENVDEWLNFGCNHYDTDRPESNPLAFWLKEDVIEYIRKETVNDGF